MTQPVAHGQVQQVTVTVTMLDGTIRTVTFDEPATMSIEWDIEEVPTDGPWLERRRADTGTVVIWGKMFTEGQPNSQLDGMID